MRAKCSYPECVYRIDDICHHALRNEISDKQKNDERCPHFRADVKKSALPPDSQKDG